MMPRHAQRFDFIPKDFVTASTLGSNPIAKPAVGVVQKVNTQERTCDIKWLKEGDEEGPGDAVDAGVSCYDIELLHIRSWGQCLGGNGPHPHFRTPKPTGRLGGGGGGIAVGEHFGHPLFHMPFTAPLPCGS